MYFVLFIVIICYPRLHLSLGLPDHDPLVPDAALPELLLPGECLAPASAAAPRQLRALGPLLLPAQELEREETLPF